MAASPILRQQKAQRIVDLGECVPCEDRPGFFEVCDTTNGSGEFHIASITTCDCRDHLVRGRVCKHQESARILSAELAAFADRWDAIAAPAPVSMDTCPRCGAPLQPNSYKVGSRGYVIFKDCTRDKWHYSVEA